MNLAESLKNPSHHAYAIIGGEAARDELVQFLEKKHKIKTHGNPDFSSEQFAFYSISDARSLKTQAGMRPTTNDGKKIFVLTMNGITNEAQNALLKLLEEPPSYAQFFFILPSAHLLLPTVKSRIYVIDTTSESSSSNSERTKEAKAFIGMSPAKRLEFIKGLMEAIAKEKREKQEAVDLLNEIQSIVYKEQGAEKGMNALKAIDVARKFSTDRAPSMKMLLEYIALNI